MIKRFRKKRKLSIGVLFLGLAALAVTISFKQIQNSHIIDGFYSKDDPNLKHSDLVIIKKKNSRAPASIEDEEEQEVMAFFDRELAKQKNIEASITKDFDPDSSNVSEQKPRKNDKLQVQLIKRSAR